MGIAFRCVLSSGGSGSGGTLTVIGSDVLAGITCTCTDGVTTLTETFPSSTPYNVVFQVPNAGSWTVSVTYHGDTHSETVVISLDQTVDLGIFHLEDWLAAGEVEGTYANLAEVLADELAVRKLCLKHNAVDYLANRFVDTNLEAIFNNGLFAKWTNNSDYALDHFYAVNDIATLMDEVDKYGYGELMVDALVKSASSTQTEEGVISSSGATLNTNAYNVFADRVYSSDYTSTYSIIYTLTNPKMVYSLGYRISSLSGSSTSHKVKAEYSEDGTSWTEIQEKSYTQSGNYSYVDELLTINKKIKAIRLTATMISTYNCGLGRLRINDIMIPKGNVPVMTANNSPYGIVDASTAMSGYEAYKAFDGNASSFWAANTGANEYLQYNFTNPTCVKRIKLGTSSYPTTLPRNVSLIASNDGFTTSTTLKTWTEDIGVSQEKYIEIENDNYYLVYRLIINSTVSGNANIATLQFYGRELSVSVPKMTGNTMPYGEASASATLSGYDAYKAFDGTNTGEGDSWYAQGTTTGYLRYKFVSPCCVKQVTMRNRNYGTTADTAPLTFEIRGSNDNFVNDDNLLGSFTNTNTASNGFSKYDITNDDEYLYYEIKVLDTVNANNLSIGQLQFYGLDYSEKEFEEGTTKKWLYDHGLELETFTAYTTGSGIAEKLPGELYIHQPSTSNSGANFYTDNIDLTPYNLLRGIVGKISKSSASVYGRLAVGPTYTDVITGNSWLGNSTFTVNNMPNNNGFDISAIDQSTRVMFMLGGGTAQLYEQTLTELWLE